LQTLAPAGTYKKREEKPKKKRQTKKKSPRQDSGRPGKEIDRKRKELHQKGSPGEGKSKWHCAQKGYPRFLGEKHWGGETKG